MTLRERFYALRRWALRTFVPEFVWPNEVNVDGVAIKLRGTPYSFATRRLLMAGGYEAHERALLRSILRPGMQVLEMGSSIGILSSVVAHHIGPTGRLVAVEASGELLSYSRTWLEQRGRVDLVQGYAFPVWESPGGLKVDHFKEGASLGGMVSFTVDAAAAGTSTRKSTSANATGGGTRTYDIKTLCDEHGLQPELLVADIEGSEAVMITQKPNYPQSLRYVLMELHPDIYPNGKADQDAIIKTLQGEGFKLKERVQTAWLFTRE